ncbi:hypothetical protein [Devosia riboflavina]|uniref:hypothetical protein n=1 Tax=Devosia riboflavina TaxID=46914 RepID=UPI001FCCAF54|nr:hypothetical protein [Devosia riboflavina]
MRDDIAFAVNRIDPSLDDGQLTVTPILAIRAIAARSSINAIPARKSVGASFTWRAIGAITTVGPISARFTLFATLAILAIARTRNRVDCPLHKIGDRRLFDLRLHHFSQFVRVDALTIDAITPRLADLTISAGRAIGAPFTLRTISAISAIFAVRPLFARRTILAVGAITTDNHADIICRAVRECCDEVPIRLDDQLGNAAALGTRHTVGAPFASDAVDAITTRSTIGAVLRQRDIGHSLGDHVGDRRLSRFCSLLGICQALHERRHCLVDVLTRTVD